MSEGNGTMKVALVGNPNSGKTTLFNALTGLRQKTGNFPGVTVEKKVGICTIDNKTVEIIDLPGSYSIYPKSIDEQVGFEVLCDEKNADFPDITLVVVDSSNLKRSLYFATQVIDLGRPTVLVLNMIDLAEKNGLYINVNLLSLQLGIPVISINAREQKGTEELKKTISNYPITQQKELLDVSSHKNIIEEVRKIIPLKSNYQVLQLVCNHTFIKSLKLHQEEILNIAKKHSFNKTTFQIWEGVERYHQVEKILDICVTKKENSENTFSKKLDTILTHKIAGYVIFLAILFVVFQFVFFIAQYPMRWIEVLFGSIISWCNLVLPAGEFTSLLTGGIVAGISGIAVFIPQIALLFLFIGILEDTGYMARVSFIMDKLMRKVGLNGRSVIPLISGVACAVPAIMSTRTIGNWKERLITIMVTPLMSCSARIPVYTLLTSLVVPAKSFWGIINLQGIVLMVLYLIGFIAAILISLLMSYLIKRKEKSYFIMEMPIYRAPQWSSIGINVLEKVKVFLWDAGKIIVAISVILWVLSSHGPGRRFAEIERKYSQKNILETTSDLSKEQNKMAAEKLENSYAGIIGKTIEPAIKPLGFDWKIGIALITSFAAREVFVGTMSTIYSVGNSENTQSIREKMMNEIDPDTGKKKYTVALGFSLMIFYAFAMQCMSTLAVVYRETKSWKWPVVQFLYMSALAYCSSLLVYQLLK